MRPGQSVTAGMLVARSREGASRHTPLSGVVVGVDESRIAIEGVWEPPERSDTHRDPDQLSPGELVDLVRDAGLVGMGGAMFPTWAKLAVGTPIDTVLVNGRESEPFVTADGRVLVEHRDEVECGLRIAMRAVGADNGLIARDDKGYPHGYETLLVQDFTGRKVPPGGRPADVGALVINTQTARHLHLAVCERRPLLERVITVDGEAVGQPGNYIVPVGTEVGRVLDHCRTDLDRAAAVLAGGPMMGSPVALDAPVTAGTTAILALTRAQTRHTSTGSCLRCGDCLQACPFDLPAGLLVDHPHPSALLCIECGVCEYSCAAHLPLVERLRAVKVRLGAGG